MPHKTGGQSFDLCCERTNKGDGNQRGLEPREVLAHSVRNASSNQSIFRGRYVPVEGPVTSSGVY